MSEAAPAPENLPKRDYSRFSPFLRNDFLVRRIHSLTGLVPLTLFLCEHLYTNTRSTQGAASFNGAVEFLTGLPLFMLIEWCGIYIPLAIHLVLGIWIATTMHNNTAKYKYAGNWRYMLQRASGIFIVLFLIVHLGHWRYGVRIDYTAPGADHAVLMTSRHYTPYNLNEQGFPVEYNTEYKAAAEKMYPAEGIGSAAQTARSKQAAQILAWSREDNMFYAMEKAFKQPAWFIFYVLGLAAACYHTGNGLWTFCITWGFIRSPKAQQRFSAVCMAFGLALFLMGVFSLAGFAWGPTLRPMLQAIGFHHTMA